MTIYIPRDFNGEPSRGEAEARKTLALELGCDPAGLVRWTHPDNGTDCLSLPDADGGEPWMEAVRCECAGHGEAGCPRLASISDEAWLCEECAASHLVDGECEAALPEYVVAEEHYGASEAWQRRRYADGRIAIAYLSAHGRRSSWEVDRIIWEVEDES